MSISSDAIVVTCECGKSYHVPRKNAGQTVRCKECGSPVQVPDAAPSMAPPTGPTPEEDACPAIDMHLDGDREVADPDTLMDEVKQSRMTRTILVSLVAHLLIVGLTSFGLFADWSEYGFIMPIEIKAEKAARAEAERKHKAKEEAEKKAEARAETAAKAGEISAGEDKPVAGKEESNYEKKVLEVSDERPTQSSITGLDGDLDLGE